MTGKSEAKKNYPFSPPFSFFPPSVSPFLPIPLIPPKKEHIFWCKKKGRGTMKKTVNLCRWQGFGISKGPLQGNDGWSKQAHLQPAMPGFGNEAHIGSDVLMKNKWGMGMRVSHGGIMMELPDIERKLSEGPKGFEGGVTDASGLPSAQSTYAAAKWKVEQLGKKQEEYRSDFSARPVFKNDRPKPRLMACSSPANASSSVWKNYLTKVQTSSPDPLYREPTDLERFPRAIKDEAAHLMNRAQANGESIRGREPARPYEVHRDRIEEEEEEATLGLTRRNAADAHGEMPDTPSDAVWMYIWCNEWDTQVKIACPWDNKLLVHRCTAELPWVLEPQWNSTEAAKELVKDCAEDFHDMCKKKGYTRCVSIFFFKVFLSIPIKPPKTARKCPQW